MPLLTTSSKLNTEHVAGLPAGQGRAAGWQQQAWQGRQWRMATVKAADGSSLHFPLMCPGAASRSTCAMCKTPDSQSRRGTTS